MTARDAETPIGSSESQEDRNESHTSSESPHMLRRLSALTATVTLALTIGSCSIGEDTQRLVVSSLNEQKADAANPKDSSGNMDNRPLSTPVAPSP